MGAGFEFERERGAGYIVSDAEEVNQAKVGILWPTKGLLKKSSPRAGFQIWPRIKWVRRDGFFKKPLSFEKVF